MPKDAIIIFERDKELSKSLALVLQPEYTTYEVTDFSDVQKIAHDVHPQILVLDLDLNREINFDMYIEFKKTHPHLPIVTMYVYSKGVSVDETQIRAFSDAVLYKPVSVEEFLKIIKKVPIETKKLSPNEESSK